MNLPSEIDVAIIGAGAAGIAAGRILRASGRSCVILEARGRIGGRAWSVALSDVAPALASAKDFTLDFGAEWLHSADVNPLTSVARAMGFVVEEGEANWGGHAGAGFDALARKEFHQALAQFWGAVAHAAQTEAADRPASDFLPAGGRWNGLIDAVSTYNSGAELDHVSILDLARFEDTRVNWRIKQGFGAFIAAMGADLPLVLNCPVARVDHAGRALRLETPQGVVVAKQILVCVPAALLAQEAIVFSPALPQKTAAAADLPLGIADKIFLTLGALHPQSLPQDGHVFGAIDRRQAISFDLRPRGAPIVAGFVGGDFARDLEQAGETAMAAEARAQLSRMLGADIANGLKFLTATRWACDPFARGSYSYARVGASHAREILAAPIDDRIFFAGEACSLLRFSTVHGAYESGETAARAILAA